MLRTPRGSPECGKRKRRSNGRRQKLRREAASKAMKKWKRTQILQWEARMAHSHRTRSTGASLTSDRTPTSSTGARMTMMTRMIRARRTPTTSSSRVSSTPRTPLVPRSSNQNGRRERLHLLTQWEEDLVEDSAPLEVALSPFRVKWANRLVRNHRRHHLRVKRGSQSPCSGSPSRMASLVWLT